jgi:plastocyanin
MLNSRGPQPIRLLPVVLLLACGGGDDAATGGAVAEADAYRVDPAEAAVVTGTIRLEGSAPAGEPIDMRDEPACAAKHEGEPALRTPVAVNDNGTLRNVFIHVTEGLGDRRFATPTDAKLIDQDGCIYIPHVTGVQTGQTVTFRNSDGLLHNVNARAQVNRAFNLAQPQNMDSNRSFAQPEIMIPVRCDVHGWMEAYVGVVAHPYFAVSGEDGTFRLENLPPGDYTIEAWHERYGTQTASVSVPAGGTAEAQFTFSESMAAGAIVPLGTPIDPHGTHAAHAHAAAGASRGSGR